MAQKSPFIDTSESIKQLAAMMMGRKTGSQQSYSLLLGAGASIGSGAPSWLQLCKKIAKDLGTRIPSRVDPIRYIVEKKLHPNSQSIDRVTVVNRHIQNLIPSIGYRHLAQLASSGFFKTIFTANWDPLLESALSSMMPITNFKVLVRGEMSDETIAKYLDTDDSRVKIVKVHGDLLSRMLLMREQETEQLSSKLKETMVGLFKKGLIIVGSELQDLDMLVPLIEGAVEGTVYYVNPIKPPPKSFAANFTNKSGGRIVISGEEGKHDVFFPRLNLCVQKMSCDAALDKKQEVEKEILLKQERGRGYINYSSISDMVEKFAKQILSSKPELVFFINDPTAPGGMELKKRMETHLKGVAIDTIQVSGEGKNRVFKRRVRTRQPGTPRTITSKCPTVFVLDAITFSGNTLNLARAQVRRWYPNALVKAGVLLISQHLKDKITKEHPLADLAYLEQTDRFEIFFPWGVTQTTGDFDRRFKDIDGYRSVHISKRPWGTIEILVDEKPCSVRLLTLEADEKLSFQRHVCRDELFVALDDNIGLDVCAENLAETFDPFNAKIKSLILEKGDYILLPRGIWHRSKAGKERCRLLEVAFGLYDQTGDIERLQDNFGRTKKDGSL